ELLAEQVVEGRHLAPEAESPLAQPDHVARVLQRVQDVVARAEADAELAGDGLGGDRLRRGGDRLEHRQRPAHRREAVPRLGLRAAHTDRVAEGARTHAAGALRVGHDASGTRERGLTSDPTPDAYAAGKRNLPDAGIPGFFLAVSGHPAGGGSRAD